ncbi:hypothetical protein Q0N40_08800 [Corynebacterium pseudokroppenstedtii]|uniref:Uncharacterized protein n=1 Tax=Corynebacterium pseudokroppenstedtii TaxID=2804917 RepID=A0AAU0Q0D2_9CORY|nr:hypothetical protein [Corynebacterium pseudokroppenstedtii]MDU7503825.1 hypothetical protein [Corynebacterium kroppenstedtii]MBY0791376.1 hypothetical protein [Corynebacterium pseudokroppenstedtii]MCF6794087.1 hypothetical protein [Corynebacterium pseudokroppenstedtii]MCF8703388.1 hypothetical protein [Corynebacterium pseudokroppenstedtii]MCG2637075.1 hypothetical protein [Corynebacterium pseudokroppenstedtii]
MERRKLPASRRHHVVIDAAVASATTRCPNPSRQDITEQHRHAGLVDTQDSPARKTAGKHESRRTRTS